MNFCEYVNFKSSGCVNNNVKYLVLEQCRSEQLVGQQRGQQLLPRTNHSHRPGATGGATSGEYIFRVFKREDNSIILQQL